MRDPIIFTGGGNGGRPLPPPPLNVNMMGSGKTGISWEPVGVSRMLERVKCRYHPPLKREYLKTQGVGQGRQNHHSGRDFLTFRQENQDSVFPACREFCPQVAT